MANIAEGFDSGSDAEFIRFLRIAKRSATEFQSHLYSALGSLQISKSSFDALYEHARRTKSLIGGFIRYLERSQAGKNSRKIRRKHALGDGRGTDAGRRTRDRR